MVHAFNPGPFALVCHRSRLHLTPQNGLTILNAEDFYAALIFASHQYFDALTNDEELQLLFAGGLQILMAVVSSHSWFIAMAPPNHAFEGARRFMPSGRRTLVAARPSTWSR